MAGRPDKQEPALRGAERSSSPPLRPHPLRGLQVFDVDRSQPERRGHVPLPAKPREWQMPGTGDDTAGAIEDYVEGLVLDQIDGTYKLVEDSSDRDQLLEEIAQARAEYDEFRRDRRRAGSWAGRTGRTPSTSTSGPSTTSSGSWLRSTGPWRRPRRPDPRCVSGARRRRSSTGSRRLHRHRVRTPVPRPRP